jgi:hypothetical protein
MGLPPRISKFPDPVIPPVSVRGPPAAERFAVFDPAVAIWSGLVIVVEPVNSRVDPFAVVLSIVKVPELRLVRDATDRVPPPETVVGPVDVFVP